MLFDQRYLALLSLQFGGDVQNNFVNDFAVNIIRGKRPNNRSRLKQKQCLFWDTKKSPLLTGCCCCCCGDHEVTKSAAVRTASNKVCKYGEGGLGEGTGVGPGICKEDLGKKLVQEALMYCVAKTANVRK